MLSPAEALDQVRGWASIADVGRSKTPLLVVDLRGLSRSFRTASKDDELASLMVAGPWVTVAVVADDLDPDFASLADAFDIIIGDNTVSTAAVDVTDVEATVDELTAAVTDSPHAAVALAQLLRVSHSVPVPQALHLESLTYGLLQTSEKYQQWLKNRPAAPDTKDDSHAVVWQRTGSLLRITLSRPDRRNALNIAMRDQLTEALELLDLDDSLDGAILQGAGSNFSAGGDLDEFGSTPSAAVGHHVRLVRSLPALMHRVRGRVRVHVHGSCVGAGIELPAFADAVIAHPEATFRLPEIGFGLVPGAGGTVSVTRRCGRYRSAWMALTGKAIDADQARKWRLVDRIDESVF